MTHARGHGAGGPGSKARASARDATADDGLFACADVPGRNDARVVLVWRTRTGRRSARVGSRRHRSQAV